MRALLRKALGLRPGDWLDLARAQAALWRAERRLRREPIGALAIREPLTDADVRGDPRRALALGLAIRRAARFGIGRPFCLAQAIALRELLLREGIRGASIRIGVRRDAGRFQAHAWVRLGDRVIGDDQAHVARFTEVDDLTVMRRA